MGDVLTELFFGGTHADHGEGQARPGVDGAIGGELISPDASRPLPVLGMLVRMIGPAA